MGARISARIVMRLSSKGSVAAVTICAFSMLASGAKAEKWNPWFEFGGFGATRDTANGQPGSGGSANLWVPLAQSSSSVFFADIRGTFFESDTQEGNFSFGYRQMRSDGWNLGAWIGYDRRHTYFDSSFDQASFGLEALHPFWDVRVNGYVPFQNDELVSSVSSSSSVGTTLAPTLSLTGNQLNLLSGGFVTTTTTNSQLRELALWGFDGEVGIKVPLSLDDTMELRAYAGGFYFDDDGLNKAIVGPKGRLELRLNNVIPEWSGSRLTFEVQSQWDDTRGDIYEAGLRLRLPFGGGETHYASLSAQEMRMSERIERDDHIVTETKATSTTTSTTTGSPFVSEKVKDALTNVQFDQVLSTGGAGTSAAVAGSTSNTLIIVDGGQGAISGAPITMKSDQTLQGGSSTIQVIGVTTGQTASFTAPGSTPTLTATGASVLVTNDNSHVVGVTVAATGAQNNIQVNGVDNVIEKSTLSGNNFGSLIAVGGNIGDLIIDDITASNVAGNQFSAFLGGTVTGGSATVTDTTLTDVGYGVFGGGYDVLTLNDITQNGGYSVGFISNTNDVEIDGYTAATLNPNVETGLSLRDGVHTANIKNLTIASTTASTSTAISLRANSAAVGDVGGINFTNLTVRNMGSGIVEQAPLAFKVGNVSITDSTFDHVTGYGLLLQNQAAGSNVAIDGTTFDFVATNIGTAVFADFIGTNLSGSGNTVTNSGTVCAASPASGSVTYNGGSTCP